ncbi:MAG: ABC transporter permease [Propionibacteriaceae bacterium]|nr:ABC transporter permease [Propionibacteriaceae bacterium]
MLQTLRNISVDNWSYRNQVWYLAVTDLKKTIHGTWLGWIWLIARPIVYVCTFWFTLEIGLRVTKNLADGVPYVVWLATGFFVWNYISAMISSGSNVYKRYNYLITKMQFPLPVISSFFSVAQLIVFALTLGILTIAMIVTRTPFSIYLLQIPLLVLLLHFTFTMWSLMTSPLSAISKDFHNLVKVMTMPLMWLSGIFFDVSQIKYKLVRDVLAFNPVTFFVKSFRASICDRYWVWQHPGIYGPYLVSLTVLVVLALRIQSRLGKEIPDVI